VSIHLKVLTMAECIFLGALSIVNDCGGQISVWL
jgi:hypothetical protein